MRLLLALILVPLLAPGAASAATVSLGSPPVDLLHHAVRFHAARGEANGVAIAVTGTEATVTESGAPLVAGPGCSLVDAHTARCAVPAAPEPDSIDAVVAALGDRGDRIAVAFPAPGQPPRAGGPVRAEAVAIVDGGSGDDALDASRAQIAMARTGAGPVLRGGPGRDTLTGGPGEDSLLGGPDADTLRGGAGRDRLWGDGPSRTGARDSDLLDGGAGTDVATYSERVAPVVVDLARGRGGAGRESDRIREVEDVVGGAGRDTLLGDGRANGLSGIEPLATARAGDVLIGRGGNDVLLGTARGARLDGGAGDDVLHSLSRRDRLACGPGGDTLAALRDGALVPRDCEWIDLGGGLLSRGTVRAGRAYFWLRAPRFPGARSACAGSVSLRSPLGAPYGGMSWTAGALERHVWFRLSVAGRSAAARHRPAVVRAACRFGAGVSWRIGL